MLKKEVIEAIKNNPDGRRNITCLWQQDDFNEKHGLKPCAFLTIWNVRHDWDGEDYLDMTMVQRSSDFATAGCINQVQYAELQLMVARECDLEPGVFTWKPINVQLYDRHIDQAIEMLSREPISDIDASLKLNEEVTSFDEIKPSDLKVLDKEAIQKVKTKNPQLSFPLGI
jgi:thymidylate synthase